MDAGERGRECPDDVRVCRVDYGLSLRCRQQDGITIKGLTSLARLGAGERGRECPDDAF